MSNQLGVWIFGVRGAVATCAIAGARAVARGFCSSAGLITESNQLSGLKLADLGDIAFGGHDIRALDTTTWESLCEFGESAGVPNPKVIAGLKGQLDDVDQWVRPGMTVGCGESIGKLVDGEVLENKLTLQQIVDQIRADIGAFAESCRPGRVVTANISSTEPYMPELPDVYTSLAALEKAIGENDSTHVRAGLLYAYAAIGGGYPYFNFTPSVCSDAPAIAELARRKKVAFAGKDGKTGETLAKTSIAPMFVARAFEVMSWEGYNIFGNRDAEVLDHPQNNMAKTTGKDAALRDILGDPAELHSRVRIDHVPSLGDWKTAWNFIHYRGFMDTKMIMQFIWQGCDSMLAAPLVLDIARLMDHAAASGRYGSQDQLACFFKNPNGGGTHDFFKQFSRLQEYAGNAVTAAAKKKKPAVKQALAEKVPS